MKKMLFLLLLLPFLAHAKISLEGEVSGFSNFIWRGTTFSENKPALQGVLEAQDSSGFYLGSFFSNAEFSDEAFGAETSVTQETDLTIGKRWSGDKWEIQLSYNRFYFPGAGVFDTDELNLHIQLRRWTLELSYMDDYFGYQSTYQYIRLGREWVYKSSIDGALFIGYNSFSNPKGSSISRCLDQACSETAYGTNGAGNPDYIDIYQVNRKNFENGLSVELAFNITNRQEYTASAGGISLDKAQDFAVITGIVYPFEL